MLNNNYFYGNHCSTKKDFLMQSYWIDEMADGSGAIRIIMKTETVTAQRMFHFVSGKRRYINQGVYPASESADNASVHL